MKARSEKHRANTGILRLAAEILRQQCREVFWCAQLAESGIDRMKAEKALRAFAARLDRAAASGTPEHVAALLGEALAAIELPEAA